MSFHIQELRRQTRETDNEDSVDHDHSQPPSPSLSESSDMLSESHQWNVVKAPTQEGVMNEEKMCCDPEAPQEGWDIWKKRIWR